MNSQVTCENCGETISGQVYGETSGMYLCAGCADERRERQWEHMGDDEMSAYFTPIADTCECECADGRDERTSEYPYIYTAPQLGESSEMPLDSEQRVYFTRAMDNLPICEVFNPEEVKRLEWLRYQIANGQMDPRS